jgi:hypothetical protein
MAAPGYFQMTESWQLLEFASVFPNVELSIGQINNNLAKDATL